MNVKPQNEPKMIRGFGLFVGLVCYGIAAYIAIRSGRVSPVLLVVGTYFLVGGLFVQPILRPVFVQWMKLAGALGWFNTRLLLGIMFYLIFAPVGFVQRLFGRDALRLARSSDPSLWMPKVVHAGGKSRYFRQF